MNVHIKAENSVRKTGLLIIFSSFCAVKGSNTTLHPSSDQRVSEQSRKYFGADEFLKMAFLRISITHSNNSTRALLITACHTLNYCFVIKFLPSKNTFEVTYWSFAITFSTIFCVNIFTHLKENFHSVSQLQLLLKSGQLNVARNLLLTKHINFGNKGVGKILAK